ncbi:MAG TPA: glycoside hydrolase family 3 C-terminal domain-containing protein, partial [Intrasporangium sp.]|uniref:glycoside hydrolase family 3 protein n=1 Tax=Intrasporangium sp. TaxID=1925024 RepID=UPI002D77D8FD
LAAVLDGEVRAVDGVEVRTRPTAADLAAVTAPASGVPGIHVVAWSADGTVVVDHDVAGTAVSFGHESGAPEAVVRASLRATVGGTGPREVGVIGAGQWSVTLAGERHSVDLSLSSGDVAEALFTPPHWTTVVEADGEVELEAEVLVPQASLARFAVAARPAPRPVRDVIEDAAAAAAEADVAVVVVGLTEEQETEAADKTTLRLPGRQDDLVSAVAAAARHTVVVINAATPVLMPWFDDVDAVLLAGIPGQEGGHAVASALLGTIEPAGRLVTSFPAADGATPAWDVVPVDGQLRYAEGPFVGYRGHHAGRAPLPALWFGHGLGYGTWDYSDVTVSSGSDEPVTVTATVTNTSSRPSREVVQVYLEPADRSQPVRLVGWRGVHVEPRESARVEVRCDERMWRRWDTRAGRWARLDGPATLLVARGLGDVRARVDLPQP